MKFLLRPRLAGVLLTSISINYEDKRRLKAEREVPNLFGIDNEG